MLAATFGFNPRERSAGLYILEPPSPKAPATHPPPKPINRSLVKLLPSKINSPFL